MSEGVAPSPVGLHCGSLPLECDEWRFFLLVLRLDFIKVLWDRIQESRMCNVHIALIIRIIDKGMA